MAVYLWLVGQQETLPENLKLTVIPEPGESQEISASLGDNYLIQEWFYDFGDKFSVLIQLGEVSVTEFFSV